MSRSNPWLVPSLLLTACAGFFLLGRWQLDRADVNRSIEVAFAGAAELPVLKTPVASAELASQRHRRAAP